MASGGNGVQLPEDVIAELDIGHGSVLLQMPHRRCRGSSTHCVPQRASTSTRYQRRRVAEARRGLPYQLIAEHLVGRRERRPEGETFHALVAHQEGDRITTAVETLSPSDLPPGDVTIRVMYSSVNVKDTLAVTPEPPKLQPSPGGGFRAGRAGLVRQR